MEDSDRLLRTVAADRRIWGLTLLLVGLPALGMLTRIGLVLETAAPLVYGYLFVSDALGLGYPGGAVFWPGFAALYFGVAAVLVGLFDWVRVRVAATGLTTHRTTE